MEVLQDRMNVFNLRDQLVGNYSSYVKSFININDEAIQSHVGQRLDEGMLWPEPLIQLNPSFEPGAWIDDLVKEVVLHPECSNIFRKDKKPNSIGQKMRLHKHQEDGSLRFRLAGELNRQYVIEISDDLSHWAPQQTNTVDAAGWMVVTEQVVAGTGARYYRARLEQ
jgi:hypothetical protein